MNEITVMFPDGQNIPIPLIEQMTVSQLKLRASILCNPDDMISVKDIVLICKGKTLENSKKLDEYGIFKGSVVFLVVHKGPSGDEITVMCPEDNQVTVPWSDQMTVRQLIHETAIRLSNKMVESDLVLMFEGKILDNSSKLNECGVMKGSSVTLSIRENEKGKKMEKERKNLVNMENYYDRLQTFDFSWPWNEKSHPFCTPESLAQCGFYHVESFTQNKDRVICYSCGIDLCNWQPSDNPKEAHRKFSPQCKVLEYSGAVNDPLRASFIASIVMSSIGISFPSLLGELDSDEN